MDNEKVRNDIYQILGKYGDDREDIKAEFRKLCEFYKTLDQGQTLPIDSVMVCSNCKTSDMLTLDKANCIRCGTVQKQ